MSACASPIEQLELCLMRPFNICDVLLPQFQATNMTYRLRQVLSSDAIEVVLTDLG